MCFHTFIIEKNKVFNLFSEKKEHVLLLFNRTYWSAASEWYPPPGHSFISLSIFTLNWHLCDRHTTPWGLPDRLEESCLAPAPKCSAPCFPDAHWSFASCEPGQQKCQPAPQAWQLARAAEAGHGRHSAPWQPLPTEGRTAITSLQMGLSKQTNKKTNAKYTHKWKKPHTLRKTQSEDSRTPLSGAFPSHGPGVPESWWGGRVVLGFLWSESTPSSPRCAWKKVVTVQTSDLFPDKITFTLRG